MTKKFLISNSISRIYNAQQMLHSTVVIEYSKLIYGITQTMLSEGYIKYVKRLQAHNILYIKIYLKYIKRNKSVINNICVISRPGKRVYKKYKKMKYTYNNLGISILSTSKGIMSNIKAKKMRIGGELICKIF